MKERYIRDLEEIKGMMQRSTRFISLSGISGVAAGVAGLAGLYLAYREVFKASDYMVSDSVEMGSGELVQLLLIAVGTLTIAAGAAIFFTTRKTRRTEQKAWNHQSRRLLIHLLIPLVTGGLLCLMFLFRGYVGILPALTLIFYGLALVNGSKFTLREIHSLGMIEIILGLLAFLFIEYGLVCWMLGFGVLHIIYGIMVQRKYKA